MDEIAKIEPNQMQQVQHQPIPDDAPLATRMCMMMERGVQVDPDQMVKMQEIAERFEANEARKAFHIAMAEFKKDPPEIFKNKTVSYGAGDKATLYKHITLAKLASILDKSLSKFDLSFKWKTEDLDKGSLKVTCILTHRLGHSEYAEMTSLPDGSGGKNAIQAKGSAVSYLQRYTLKAVAGVAEEDQDDDGAAAGSGSTNNTTPAFVPLTSAEFEVVDVVLALLPSKAGHKLNKGRITAILSEKSRQYILPEHVNFLAEQLVQKCGDHDLYEVDDSESNESPGTFEN